jgi:predicted nucleotidyltransferase
MLWNEVIRVAAGYRCEVFIFGSALATMSPRDIDLVIVYPETDAVLDGLRARSHIRTLVRNASFRADILALSRHEEQKEQFVRRVGGVRVSDWIAIR